MRKKYRSHNNKKRNNFKRSNKNNKSSKNNTQGVSDQLDLKQADLFIKAINASKDYKYFEKNFPSINKVTVNTGYKVGEEVNGEVELTLLMYAITQLNVDAVLFLLEKDADPNMMIRDKAEKGENKIKSVAIIIYINQWFMYYDKPNSEERKKLNSIFSFLKLGGLDTRCFDYMKNTLNIANILSQFKGCNNKVFDILPLNAHLYLHNNLNLVTDAIKQIKACDNNANQFLAELEKQNQNTNKKYQIVYNHKLCKNYHKNKKKFSVMENADSRYIAQLSLLNIMPIFSLDNQENTMMHHLASRVDLNKSIVELLINYYLRVDVVNHNRLFEIKVFFMHKNKNGETPAFIAISHKNKNFISLLVKYYPDLIDDDAIIYAIMKALTSKGDEFTDILKLMAKNTKIEKKIKKLEEYKGNKKKVDEIVGWNAIEPIQQNNDKSIITSDEKMLLELIRVIENGASYKELHKHFQGKEEAIKKIVDQEFEYAKQTKYLIETKKKITPLILAIKLFNYDALNFLLEMDADPNKEIVDHLSPLIYIMHLWIGLSNMYKTFKNVEKISNEASVIPTDSKIIVEMFNALHSYGIDKSPLHEIMVCFKEVICKDIRKYSLFHLHLKNSPYFFNIQNQLTTLSQVELFQPKVDKRYQSRCKPKSDEVIKQIVKSFLLNTITLNSIDKNGEHSIHYLARNHGKLSDKEVSILFDEYYNRSKENSKYEHFAKKNNRGLTPAALAAQECNVVFLKCCLEKDLKLFDSDTVKYLITYSLLKKQEAISLLKQCAEKKEIVDLIKQNPTYQKHQEKVDEILGWKQVEQIKFLDANEISSNHIKDQQKISNISDKEAKVLIALKCAIDGDFSYEMLSSTFKDREKILKKVINKSFEYFNETKYLNESEPRLLTPLMLAIKKMNYNGVKYLLDMGADPNFVDEDLINPLLYMIYLWIELTIEYNNVNSNTLQSEKEQLEKEIKDILSILNALCKSGMDKAMLYFINNTINLTNTKTTKEKYNGFYLHIRNAINLPIIQEIIKDMVRVSDRQPNGQYDIKNISEENLEKYYKRPSVDVVHEFLLNALPITYIDDKRNNMMHYLALNKQNLSNKAIAKLFNYYIEIFKKNNRDDFADLFFVENNDNYTPVALAALSGNKKFLNLCINKYQKHIDAKALDYIMTSALFGNQDAKNILKHCKTKKILVTAIKKSEIYRVNYRDIDNIMDWKTTKKSEIESLFNQIEKRESLKTSKSNHDVMQINAILEKDQKPIEFNIPNSILEPIFQKVSEGKFEGLEQLFQMFGRGDLFNINYWFSIINARINELNLMEKIAPFNQKENREIATMVPALFAIYGLKFGVVTEFAKLIKDPYKNTTSFVGENYLTFHHPNKKIIESMLEDLSKIKNSVYRYLQKYDLNLIKTKGEKIERAAEFLHFFTLTSLSKIDTKAFIENCTICNYEKEVDTIFTFLSEKVLTITTKNKKNETFAHFAAYDLRLSDEKTVRVMQYLHAQGLKLNLPNQKNETPLFHAVYSNKLQTVKFLLSIIEVPKIPDVLKKSHKIDFGDIPNIEDKELRNLSYLSKQAECRIDYLLAKYQFEQHLDLRAMRLSVRLACRKYKNVEGSLRIFELNENYHQFVWSYFTGYAIDHNKISNELLYFLISTLNGQYYKTHSNGKCVLID